jgi:hypothetical protein
MIALLWQDDVGSPTRWFHNRESLSSGMWIEVSERPYLRMIFHGGGGDPKARSQGS